MSDIFNLTPGKQSWRDNWVRATYNNAPFHCESNSRESGRRIVEHEFPKKDIPYAEDMGRHAREFTIRAYLVVYPRDSDDLNQIDYTIPRNRLMAELEKQGPGVLQLSTQPPQDVVVTRYRMMEEQRFGGFCVFDITFIEYGLNPVFDPSGSVATDSALASAAQGVRDQVQRTLAPPNPSVGTGLPGTIST